MNLESKATCEALFQVQLEKSKEEAKNYYRRMKAEEPGKFAEVVKLAPKEATAFWEVVKDL